MKNLSWNEVLTVGEMKQGLELERSIFVVGIKIMK